MGVSENLLVQFFFLRGFRDEGKWGGFGNGRLVTGIWLHRVEVRIECSLRCLKNRCLLARGEILKKRKSPS